MIAEPAVAGRQQWTQVLQALGHALPGHLVGLWESDGKGGVRPLAINTETQPPVTAQEELAATIREWRADFPQRTRWLASRVSKGHWCIAPVRHGPPGPPPAGLERRGPERLTLELAGMCIGMLDEGDQPGSMTDTRDMLRAFEDFFEHATIGMHLAAADGTILHANQAELDMLGVSREEYVGGNLLDYHVDRQAAADCLRRIGSGETLHNVEALIRRKDGTLRNVLISSNGRFDESGKFLHTRCLTRDISERKAIELRLAQSLAIIESANDAIIAKTLDGTITSWNGAAERLYGYSAAEAIGKNISIIIPPERADELPSILERVGRGERVPTYETIRMRKDGTRVDVSLAVSPYLDASGRPIGASAVARDITDQKKFAEQMMHGAMHDPLTDLPNRTFFIERVALAMDRARRDEGYRFALVFLDLDNFKVINDSLGHEVGDRLLTRIAARLQTLVRPGDVVARLGGDEFTMLLEDVSSMTDVERATRRIEQAMAAPFLLEGRDVVVTASVGVALSAEGFDRPEDLLRDADIAMYRAKTQGRGRYEVFNVGMRDRAHARFDMEADLRQAIERGELRLLFQPIVTLRTGRVHAFEALLRWHHGERGVIMPLDFIPLAEETGLILPIGAWVLREACWHARRWHNAFPEAGPMRVSVNVSPKQLADVKFVDEVQNALREERLEPFRLRLEITESALMDNIEASADVLAKVRGLGVELHMDDFGTGFSSLSYLPQLPLQTIKIDRSFTHRMGLRRTDQELVRSIVDLARNLGMGVIAEGVENVLQCERLIAFGCELGQGFHFARPLEPVSAGALLGMDPQAND